MCLDGGRLARLDYPRRTKFGAERGINVDWGTFADTWRGAYRPSMDRYGAANCPGPTSTTLHRMVLDELLVKFGISGLSDGDIDHLNRVWHRLDPLARFR